MQSAHSDVPASNRAGINAAAACQVAALAMVLLCGCGTVTTRIKGAGGPYSGFSLDVEKMGSAEEWLNQSFDGRVGNVPLLCPRGLFWMLDVPVSVTADTLLLPVDALRSTASKPAADTEGAK